MATRALPELPAAEDLDVLSEVIAIVVGHIEDDAELALRSLSDALSFEAERAFYVGGDGLDVPPLELATVGEWFLFTRYLRTSAAGLVRVANRIEQHVENLSGRVERDRTPGDDTRMLAWLDERRASYLPEGRAT